MQQEGDRAPIGLDGIWLAATADDDLRRSAPEPDHDDTDWVEVPVPGHWRSVAALADADGPVLHRRRFDAGPLADGDRAWFVLEGVMATADVWLDGAYLGDVEGGAVVHQLEVTEQLRDRSSHVAVVEVACPPPLDRSAKRHLTGLYGQGELVDPRWNPGGLWRSVRVERSGPVRIASHRWLCTRADEREAVVTVRFVLDAAAATTATVRTSVAGVLDVRDVPLAAGRNVVGWDVAVPEPRLWWPWALGDQHLHDAGVEVRLPDAGTSDARSLRIGLRQVRWEGARLRVNDEPLFFKGTALVPARDALALAPDELLEADIRRVRDCGLDLARVLAHVSRPALYEAADRLGVVVWQDLPLQGGYQRSVRRQARREAEALVDRLGHHPAVVVWCAHDAPVPVAPTSHEDDEGRRRRQRRRQVAAEILPTWNKDVLDRSLHRTLATADPSRGVIAHTGVLPGLGDPAATASHLFVGWHHGEVADLPRVLRRWPALGRLVGAVGAQAVPPEAPWLASDRWPDLDEDEARLAGGLDVEALRRHVDPAGFATPAAWAEATQRYRARLVRRHLEELRRRKWRPCTGFVQRSFAAGHAGDSWAVLDHERRPTAGHEALVAACRPVVVVPDQLPDVVAPGERLVVQVHAVSDARIAHSDMVATVCLSWRYLSEDDERRPPWSVLAEIEQDAAGAADRREDRSTATSTWRWCGELPPDSCVLVGSVVLDVPPSAHGRVLVLDAALAGEGVEARNRRAALVRSR